MASRSWRPTCFVRFVRSTPSSTSPALVVTDAGEAFLKALNNPAGPHALARELVGTGLAAWLGLETFDYAIMRVREVDEIPLTDGKMAAAGPAYLTRRVVDGIQWGGDGDTLDLLENREAITRLVILDTWTRNPDRHPPAGSPRRPRPDNVFLAPGNAEPGRRRLIAMDHTECFSGRAELGRSLANIDGIRDEGLFGAFPEFLPRIDFEVAKATADRLGSIARRTVEDLVQEIPTEWAVSDNARTALCEFIHQRAGFVANTVVNKLGEQCGELPLHR
jgi:hypothetical protein